MFFPSTEFQKILAECNVQKCLLALGLNYSPLTEFVLGRFNLGLPDSEFCLERGTFQVFQAQLDRILLRSTPVEAPRRTSS